MLSRLFVLGLAVAVFSLASPCQALIDPTADVKLWPSLDPTAETALTGQIQATTGIVVGAHSGDAVPPTPSDYYADSHTVVFGNLSVNKSGIFTLDKFNQLDEFGQPRLIDGNPIGKLQGLLLYFTVQLKSGRQVLDNESTTKEVANAIVEIGTSLTVLSVDKDGKYDPTIGVNCAISPSASASGKLFADTDGPDYPTRPLPFFELMSQEWIEAASMGTDRLAAIIDPDAASSREEVNAIKLDTDPAHTAILAAFTSTGTNDKTVSFSYASLYNENHTATQLAIGWSIPVKFDLEARVVYLYAAAVPEPASMGLLAAAFVPVLARRLRKRKTRLA
jgi:hypothetical protein